MGSAAGTDGDSRTMSGGHQLSAQQKVALCILHGLAPYLFHDMLRVRTLLGAEGSPFGLAWNLHILTCQPWTTSSQGKASSYTPIDWDDIPDQAWDNVSAQLLANLFTS